MTYTLIPGSSAVRRDSDGAFIPADPRNSDWLAYQAWAAAGNTAAAAPGPTQAQLRAALLAAASSAAAFVVAQVMPDAAHQTAFQNAASIVNGAGGAPSSGPLATKFAALAAAYGMSANSFAALVLGMQGASLDLSASLATLSAASAAAASAADLASALATFETAIAAVVAEVNAASPPVAIASPAAIVIAGVNA